MTKGRKRSKIPLFTPENEDNIEFIKENAVSLVREKDAIIRRQREELARLSHQNEGLRKRNRMLQANLELTLLRRI